MTREAFSVSFLLPRLLPIAREAGEIIMRHFGGSRVATAKADDSPVTEADREADAYIIRYLASLAPDIAIVSEEGPKPNVRHTPYFWLVDPLDGTRSFVRGTGSFTVNIGLIGPDRLPLAGVIYDPAARAMYWGGEGKAYRQFEGKESTRISVRKATPGKVVAIVSNRNLNALTEKYLATHNIAERLPCPSSIKFCRLAEGAADVYPRFGPTMEWDTAAGDAILQAAGGTMLTPEGKPYLYGKPKFENGNFIASGNS